MQNDTDTVTLTRTPLNIPLVPRSHVYGTGDNGHMGLGTASAIANDPQRGIAHDQAAPQPRQEMSPAGSSSGIVGLAKAADFPREVVSGAAQWFKDGTQLSSGELADIDARDLAQSQQDLKQLWGPKYQANVDALARYIGALPQHEADLVLNARDPATGGAYMNDPANVVRLAGLARSSQPAAMTIEGIEALMRSNPAGYRKNEALQARYRELIDERERTRG